MGILYFGKTFFFHAPCTMHHALCLMIYDPLMEK